MRRDMLNVFCATMLVSTAFVNATFADIAGSSLTAITKYTPGVTNRIVFRCDAQSSDDEYIYSVVVNYLGGMNVLAGYSAQGNINDGTFSYNGAVGDAAIARWDSDENLGVGDGSLDDGESAYFTNDVFIGASVTGDLVITYSLLGDGYGSEPHGLTNTLALLQAAGAELPTVVTEAPSAVTWDFAVLQGRSNPEGFTTTVYFEYGTDTTYGAVSPEEDIGDGIADVDISFTTTELEPNSTYNYRLVSYNVNGTNYGSNVVFSTIASPVNSPSMWFQPIESDFGVAASQLDSTQPFDARAADDFLYSSPTPAIGQVRWWMAEWNGAPPYVTPSSFNIYVYTNYPGGSGCYPTNVIQTWNIPTSECHEEIFDAVNRVYSYWADLSPAFQPVVNVHYWIVIQPVLDYAPQAGLKYSGAPVNLCKAMQIFALAGLPDWTVTSAGLDIAYVLYPSGSNAVSGVLGTNGLLVVSGEAASISKGTDFGDVASGSLVTNVFSITNAGTSALLISGVTTNGPDAASFSSTDIPASVAAGSVSNFSVVFNAGSTGVYSAALSMVNNSPVSPYVVNLAGRSIFSKTDPNIISWPTATAITYGQSLSNAVLSGGSADVAGAFDFTTPSIMPNAGTNNQNVVFNPTDSANYNSVSGSVSVTVNKAGQTITFPNPGTQIMSSITPLTATADSGLPVVYTVQYGPASLTNGNALVYSATGEVTVRASQAGNANYAAAVDKTVGFRVVAKGMHPCDFDGDGISDIAVINPNNSEWFIRYSGGGVLEAFNWGWSETVPAIGDFDGDGITDFAVYHQTDAAENWYILQSSDGLMMSGGPIDWGWGETIPVPGDYDGDGITDLAVYWPEGGNWYIRYSSGGTLVQNWGWSEAVPVPGDYDGDGITDLAVYYQTVPEGNWYILQSSDGTMMSGGPINWGWGGTLPVPGDYEGDGVTDLAIYWPEYGKWRIRFSRGGIEDKIWGWNETVPVPGDYDGDGVTDFTVYWKNDSALNWYVRKSRSVRLLTGAPIDWGWRETVPVQVQYWINRLSGLWTGE